MVFLAFCAVTPAPIEAAANEATPSSVPKGEKKGYALVFSGFSSGEGRGIEEYLPIWT
jgi:hypothetical protein